MLKKTLALVMFAVLSVSAFAAQAKTVEIEGMNSLKFSKENITVKPGEEVTIKLTNTTDLPESAMAHNWILLAADADAQAVDEAARATGQTLKMVNPLQQQQQQRQQQ